MNSVERLDAALAGVEVDRPPFSFWYNFGLQHMSGEAVADAHIAFARRFRPDFLRVMNSYPYPLGSGSRSFDRATDLLRIPAVTAAEEGYWGHQLRALNKIVKALRGEIWAVESIDSPWTHLCRLSNRNLVFSTANRRPEIVKAALDVISASQVKYVQKAMETGIKGIFFTVTEAGYDALDPIRHEELCKLYNERILKAASELPFNILRLDSNKLYFDTLTDYPASVVSWSHFRTMPGLVKGLLEWKRCVMGGINYESLAGESAESLRGYFEKYAEEFFINKMIIAPSGVLPSDISPYVLDGMIDAIESLRSMGRFLRPEMLKVKSAAKRPGVEEYYTKPGRGFDERSRRVAERFEDAVPEEAESAFEISAAEQVKSASAAVKGAEPSSAAPSPDQAETENPEKQEEAEAENTDTFGIGASFGEDDDFGIVSADGLEPAGDSEEYPSAQQEEERDFPSVGFRRADYESEDESGAFGREGEARRRFDAAFRRDRTPGADREREGRFASRGGRFDGAKRKDYGKERGRRERERSSFGGRRDSFGGKKGKEGRGFASSHKREDRFDRNGGSSRREREFGGKSRFGGRRDFEKRFEGDRKRDFSGRGPSKSGSVRRVRIPRERQR